MNITGNNYQAEEDFDKITYTGEIILNDLIYIDYVMIYDIYPHDDEEGNVDIIRTLSEFSVMLSDSEIDITGLINEEKIKELIESVLD
jgi:hypothetical protein